MYAIFEKLCNEKGVTPYKVSKATNISTATLSDWKTGKSHPKANKIKILADYFGVSPEYIQTGKNKFHTAINANAFQKAVQEITGKNIMEELENEFGDALERILQDYRIPVLRRVAAGIPIDSQEELIGYEEISDEMAENGTYFGLQIQGDSMEPGILDRDIVIVRQQEEAENGQIVVALINGNDGCCKRLKKYDDGSIALMSDNPMYPPMFFSVEETENTPVQIKGIVKELRRRF